MSFQVLILPSLKTKAHVSTPKMCGGPGPFVSLLSASTAFSAFFALPPFFSWGTGMCGPALPVGAAGGGTLATKSSYRNTSQRDRKDQQCLRLVVRVTDL